LGEMSGFPPVICPCCRERVTATAEGEWACPTCPGSIRMVQDIPVFAVASDQLTEVISGIRASHRFNLQASAGEHLAYTAHTMECYEIIRHLIERAFPQVTKRLTVLDVGGGRGELALKFAQSFDTAMIDVDLFSVRVAQAFQKAGPRFQALCGDCSSLSFASDSIDVVICKETAHHMRDSNAFFAEMARVVRRKGLVVIIESVHAALTSRERTAARDGMRQLGATHHHFLLGDITKRLSMIFGEVCIAWVRPNLFREVFTKAGIPGVGDLLDVIWDCMPRTVCMGALGLFGGTAAFACRRPTAGLHLRQRSRGTLVDYPIELADLEPMPSEIVGRIRSAILP